MKAVTMMKTRSSVRTFWAKRENRVVVLRLAVTLAFVIAGAAVGCFSYFILSDYEMRLGRTRYDHVADYAANILVSDFADKRKTILSMAKNMGYFKPDVASWPNVAMPGFYDSDVILAEVPSLNDLWFLPIVQPEDLPAFEEFMYGYFDSESAIPDGAGISPSGRGVYSLDANNINGSYHDTTGVTTQFESPNHILVPMTQLLFTSYLRPEDLAVNVHSVPQIGPALDAIIECSKTTNYSIRGQDCASISSVLPLPLGSSAIQSFHSVIFQPIFLNQNASQLVGFAAGGFDWVEQVTQLFSMRTPGVMIVVVNGPAVVTFRTTSSALAFLGFGDSHDSKYDRYVHTEYLFPTATGGDDSAAYKVYIYPTDEFFADSETFTPLITAIASGLLIGLFAVVFLMYDMMVRRESAARATVLETKRRFVRFISHEVRSPLNAVHLGLEALTAEVTKMLEYLSKGCSNDTMTVQETLRSWLELSSEMMGNSESAVDVLNDLLNYDKIEMGTLRLDFASIDIWELVRNSTVGFLNQTKEKNVRMVLNNNLIARSGSTDEEDGDTSQDLVVVGDATRLAQSMRSLISNALRYTPNDGRIVVECERVLDGLPSAGLFVPAENAKLLAQPRAGSIRISVTDSGAGLSDAELKRIRTEGVVFDAKDLQAGKGSGLGLCMAKGLAEQHGGTFTVTSVGAGWGTTFTIELPLFKRVYVEVSTKTARRVKPTGARIEDQVYKFTSVKPVPTFVPPATVKRILVVDDVMSCRKMLIRILNAKGYVCEQAEDGQQAIDKYLASMLSGELLYAITMDFEMPVMNGPTATAKLRQLGCTLPIIGLTGNLLPEDISYYKAQGANEVLGKPLNLSKFELFMDAYEAKFNERRGRVVPVDFLIGKESFKGINAGTGAGTPTRANSQRRSKRFDTRTHSNMTEMEDVSSDYFDFMTHPAE